MAAKFTPPPWCRPPRDPKQRAQTACFVGAGGIRSASLVEFSAKAVYTIGREAGVDVRLRGELASRMHAAVCQDVEGTKFLVDLRSANGTFLGGRRLEPHVPVRWEANVTASFGSGDKAENLLLSPPALEAAASEDAEAEEAAAKRRRTAAAEDPLAALYGDLPEATVTQVAPRIEERRRPEPIPAPKEPTRIIFLDIDGVLRSVHGRTDFANNVRTMLINGSRVALMGDSSDGNLAGIDFWPQAMRALKHIVSKTGAGICLSSDWRKADELVAGVNNQLTEYGMPKLVGCTPDLDKKDTIGVVKAIHSNVREKRAKEIRRWLRQNPKVERWVALDDMDLSANRKDELLHEQSGSREPMPFLDPETEFVRCNPAVGLTSELAKVAVSFLNGVEVSWEEIQAAYNGTAAAQAEASQPDPNWQGLGPTILG